MLEVFIDLFKSGNVDLFLNIIFCQFFSSFYSKLRAFQGLIYQIKSFCDSRLLF